MKIKTFLYACVSTLCVFPSSVHLGGPRSHDSLVAVDTSCAHIVVSLGDMFDSKAEERKAQDDSGIFCVPKRMGTC